MLLFVIDVLEEEFDVLLVLCVFLVGVDDNGWFFAVYGELVIE